MYTSIGRGNPTLLTPEHITPRAKRVIESAIREAGAEGKSYVGTEHILIGILSDTDNYATRFIAELGGSLQDIFKRRCKYLIRRALKQSKR